LDGDVGRLWGRIGELVVVKESHDAKCKLPLQRLVVEIVGWQVLITGRRYRVLRRLCGDHAA
jgi:hypothetical protein